MQNQNISSFYNQETPNKEIFDRSVDYMPIARENGDDDTRRMGGILNAICAIKPDYNYYHPQIAFDLFFGSGTTIQEAERRLEAIRELTRNSDENALSDFKKLSEEEQDKIVREKSAKVRETKVAPGGYGYISASKDNPDFDLKKAKEDYERELENKNTWKAYLRLRENFSTEIITDVFRFKNAEGSRTDVAELYVDKFLEDPEWARDFSTALQMLSLKTSAGFWDRVGTRIGENFTDSIQNIKDYFYHSEKPEAVLFSMAEHRGLFDEKGNLTSDEAALAKLKEDFISEMAGRQNVRMSAVSPNSMGANMLSALKTANALYGDTDIASLANKGKELFEKRKYIRNLRSALATQFDYSNGEWETLENAFVYGFESLKYIGLGAAGTAATGNPYGGIALNFAMMYAEEASGMYGDLRFSGVNEEDAAMLSAGYGVIAAALEDFQVTKFGKFFKKGEAVPSGFKEYVLQGLRNSFKDVAKESVDQTATELAQATIGFAAKKWAAEHANATFEEKELWDNYCEEVEMLLKTMPMITVGLWGVGSPFRARGYLGRVGANWGSAAKGLVSPIDVLENNVQSIGAIQSAEKYAEEVKNTIGANRDGREWLKQYFGSKSEEEKTRLLNDRFKDDNERYNATLMLQNLPQIDEAATRAYLGVKIDAAKKRQEEHARVLGGENTAELSALDAMGENTYSALEQVISALGMEGDVSFVSNAKELSELGGISIQEAERAVNDNRNRGFFEVKSGKIIILKDNLASGADAITTFAHEYGHFIMDKIRKNDLNGYNRMCDEVLSIIGGEGLARYYLPQEYSTVGTSQYIKGEREVAEEVLMRTVEDVTLKRAMDAKKKSVWARFKAWFGGLFDAKTLAELSNERLAEIALDVLQNQKTFKIDLPAPSKKWRATTPEENGEEASGEYELWDIAELIASTDEGYDDALQPRNRSRRSSKEQVAKIAMNLNPKRLDASETTDEGAPIIDGRRMVVSGNGRILAIREAYESGKANEYRKHVLSRAKQMGLHVPSGIKNPVLVRRVDNTGSISMEEFAARSNKSQVAGMSVAEQAVADGRRIIEANLLDIFFPDSSGNVLSAGNRDFINAFLNLVGGSEQYKNKDGSLRGNLSPRVKAAVLAAMLSKDGNRETIERLLDNPEGYSALINGLMQCAANVAELVQKPDYDISAELSDAVELYVEIRNKGQTVDEFLAQGDMFREMPSDEVIFLLRLFEENQKSQSGISGVLTQYASECKKIDTTTQALFADDNPTKIEKLQSAYDHYALDISQNSSQGNLKARIMEDTRGAPSEAEIADAERQIEEVRAKYVNTPQWLKAPNGNPTNLTERQWLMARTPNFKKWFGDWENDPQNASKVVDENGEPLVVYHGTRATSRFNVFKGSEHFFSDNREVADGFLNGNDFVLEINGDKYPVSRRDLEILADMVYADASEFENLLGDWEAGDLSSEGVREIISDITHNEYTVEALEDFPLSIKEGGRIIEAFLNIRNPVEVDYGGETWQAGKVMPEQDLSEHPDADGLIGRNIREGGLLGETRKGEDFPISTDYVVRDSTQIKSVDNVGTFRADNPDIRWKITEDDIGKPFNEVRKKIPYSGDNPVSAITEKRDFEAEARKVEAFLRKRHQITAVDGMNVNLRSLERPHRVNGEQQPPTLLERARHLIGKENNKGEIHRELDYEKLAWVYKIPETLRTAQAVFLNEWGSHKMRAYVKNYEGTLHIVLVNQKGETLGHLITQFPQKQNERHAYLRDARLWFIPTTLPNYSAQQAHPSSFNQGRTSNLENHISSSFNSSESQGENLKSLLRQERAENPVVWASIVLAREILQGKSITQPKLERVLPAAKFDGTKRQYAIERAKQIAERCRATQENYRERLDEAVQLAEIDLYWSREVMHEAYNAFRRDGEEYGIVKQKLLEWLKNERQRDLDKIKGLSAEELGVDIANEIENALEKEPERKKPEENFEEPEEEFDDIPIEGIDEEFSGAKKKFVPSTIRDIVSKIRMETTKAAKRQTKDENVRRRLYRNTLVSVLRDAAKRLTYGKERESIMKKISDLSRKGYAVIKIKDGERAGQKIDNFTLRAEHIALRIFNRGVRDTKAELTDKLKKALKNVKTPKRVMRDDKRKMSGKAEERAKRIKNIAEMSVSEIDEEIEKTTDAINKADSKAAEEYEAKLIDAVSYLEDLQRFGAFKEKSRADMAEAVDWIENYLESETEHQAERVEKLKAEAAERRQIFIDAINEITRNANFDGNLRKNLRSLINASFTFKDLLLTLGRSATGEKRRAFENLVNGMASDCYAATSQKENEILDKQEEFQSAIEKIYKMPARDALKRLLGRSDKLQKFSVQAKPMSVQIALQRLSMAEQEHYKQNVYIHCIGKSEEYADLERAIDKIKLSGLGSYEKEMSKQSLALLEKQRDAIVNQSVDAYAQELRAALSKEDLELLDWFRDFYKRERGSLSDANEAVTGLGIPEVDPNYTPMKMLREGGTNEKIQVVAIVPKSLSPRVSNSLDMDESVGIVDIWNKRVAENAHYKAFSQLNIEWRGIFAHADFHAAVNLKFGKDTLNQLLDFFNDIMSVRLQNQMNIGIIDKANGLYAISALGFNLGSAWRQTTSIPAFMNFMGMGDFIKYTKEGIIPAHLTAASGGKLAGKIGNPEARRAVKEILNSKNAKRRMQKGNNQVLVEALDNIEDSKFWAWYKRNALVLNKWGDMVPILTVGQGFYRAKTKEYAKTMPLDKAKEKAMNEMWMIAEMSQQSSSVMNAPVWTRRGGSIAKATALFTSQPQLMVSREVEAFNRFNAVREKYKKNPKDKEIMEEYLKVRRELAKVVFVNHVLVQGGYMLATLIWKAILGDDWDEGDAYALLGETIAGPMGGLIVLGRFVSAFYSKYAVSTMPLEGFGRTIANSVELVQDLITLEWEDVAKDLDKIGKNLFAPYREASKIYKNATDNKEGVVW